MHYTRMKKWIIVIALIMIIAPTFGASAEILAPSPIQYKGSRQTAILRNEHFETIGIAQYWNTKTKFIVELLLYDNWLLTDAQVFAGSENELPPMSNENAQPGAFPCKRDYPDTPSATMIQCDLELELDFSWGSLRTRNVAFHGDVQRLESDGVGLANDSFWAVPVNYDEILDEYVINEAIFTPFNNQTWGGYFTAWWTHPDRGHFRGPIAGLTYDTTTQWGITDDGGGFGFFPGETVDLWLGEIYLGNAIATQKISSLDIFEYANLNIGENAHPDNFAAVNMARLLYTLDSEGTPSNGSIITEPVITCLNTALADLYVEDETVNFYDDLEVEALIDQTLFYCSEVEGVNLVKISFEEAYAILDKDTSSTMFRKNVSKSPELETSKSKLNIMGVWFPALKANNEPAYYIDESGNLAYGVPYYDENGALINVAQEAKPIVVTYTDADEETGAHDVWVAISRDDGQTFKRKNVARAAFRTSFTLENGEPFYGTAKKPVMQVKGNNIMVAWTSKFCKGGRPTYAIKTEDTLDDPTTPENEYEENYPYDDPYYEEDIWGVAGPQRSVDYTDQGFPEVGEVPYSCVWVARGTVVSQEMINQGGFWAQSVKNEDGTEKLDDEGNPIPYYHVGDIVWFKPERLTSGRRDANQVFMGAADDAGFAIAWQEDPDGLRPGQAKGPGEGWGGATTNHKTDIWYSYITWKDFKVVDENFISHGDQEQKAHDDDEVINGRPKALVPMSLPIRLTDNDSLNTDNLLVELNADGYPVEDENGNWIPIPKEDYPLDSYGDHMGSHAYGHIYRDQLCTGFFDKINHQGVLKRVCIAKDGRLMDGNTGASRPNLFLQKYKKPDGTVSAWAIFAYDESKGMGSGPPDHEEGGGPYGGEYVAECGKNSFYDSFEFQTPRYFVDENEALILPELPKHIVSSHTILNLPEKEYTVSTASGFDPDFGYVGDAVYDVTIDSNISYVVDEQGVPIFDYKGDLQIDYENARRPRFIMQGKSNMGESRTIMLIVYKEGEEGSGRPSDIMLRRVVVPPDDKGNPYKPENIYCGLWETAANGQVVCVDGAQNISTGNPIKTTPPSGTPTTEDPYGDIKVIEWEQSLDTLAWPSGVNHYEDSRGHRGALDGDFVAVAYTYTPNWAAFRNGNDKYDLYVRRSFDGGLTWTTDPNGVLMWDIGTDPETGQPMPVEGNTYSVVNCDTFTDPTKDEFGNDVPTGTTGPHYKYTVCKGYLPGEFEQARNISQLKNNKSSVIEPRLVKTPGVILRPGEKEATGEDCRNPQFYYVTWGTASNEKKVWDELTEKWIKPAAVPMDLYYTFTYDRGENYVDIAWEVNPDSLGNHAGETVFRYDYLAKGDPEQGEAQIRMTPDGSRFYATWVQDGEDKYGNPASDVWFRRIMPPEFWDPEIDMGQKVCTFPKQPTVPPPEPPTYSIFIPFLSQ